MRNAAAMGAAGWALASTAGAADAGAAAEPKPGRNYAPRPGKAKPEKTKAKPKPERAPAAGKRVTGGKEVIRCGFIGVGSRGSSILQSTLGLEGVAVVAVTDTYDVWRDRALGWCKAKRPEVGSYVHFEDMFDKEKLDAVVIATPDHIHEPAILYALDQGYDMYTEKPMTLTWEGAKRVRDRVAEKGAVLQVGTQLRSMPMYQKAREIVQSGALGPLALVQVNRHSSEERLDLSRVPGEATEKTVHWKPFLRDSLPCPYDPLRYFWWRQFVEYSNGYFGDLMLHHLDICHFVTGCAMPRRVKAVGGVYVLKDGRTCPDTVSALLEYGEGFHFNYTTTAANEHYGLVERYLFENGAIEVRGMNEMSIFRKDIEEKVPSEGILNEPHLQNFFDCVRTRQKPIAPVEAGLMGAACARMAFESMGSGSAAAWDPVTESVEG
jgi:predicted dehydrogenase